MFETKGFKDQRQAPSRFGGDELTNPFTQCAWFQIARIDMMAQFGQAFKAIPLFGNGLGHGALFVGQRMSTARLGIAFEQSLGFGVEEKKLQIQLIGAKRSKLLWQHRNTLASANVDGNSHLVVTLLSKLVDKLLQQLRRHVIDAIVIGILQHVESD